MGCRKAPHLEVSAISTSGHSFTRTLHAKGLFVYCNKCGLIRLNNKATVKAINKPCGGLRDLEDDEYIKTKGVKR
jgi:hypothetical protein